MMGAITGGIGLLVAIEYVTILAMGEQIAPWHFMVPVLVIWLAAGYSMTVPVRSHVGVPQGSKRPRSSEPAARSSSSSSGTAAGCRRNSKA